MTIADVIERIYRDFLARATDTPTLVRLAATIDSSQQNIDLESDDLTPEETSLIVAGTPIEIGREMVRVVTFDEVTGAVVAARGQYGTTGVAHTIGDVATVAPAYSRQSVFDAVADAIDGLYPDLWTTTTEIVSGEAVGAFPNADYLDVISVVDQLGNNVGVSLRRNFGEVDTNAAILFPSSTWGYDTHVTFKVALTRPTSEADELSDLGISDRWVQLIVIDAVQSLMRGHELDKFTLEFLTESIESSGSPPGSVTDVATAMLRYREYLMGRAKLALYRDHPMRVEYESVI